MPLCLHPNRPSNPKPSCVQFLHLYRIQCLYQLGQPQLHITFFSILSLPQESKSECSLIQLDYILNNLKRWPAKKAVLSNLLCRVQELARHDKTQQRYTSLFWQVKAKVGQHVAVVGNIVGAEYEKRIRL
jgi:hypothetical protein